MALLIDVLGFCSAPPNVWNLFQAAAVAKRLDYVRQQVYQGNSIEASGILCLTVLKKPPAQGARVSGFVSSLQATRSCSDKCDTEMAFAWLLSAMQGTSF